MIGSFVLLSGKKIVSNIEDPASASIPEYILPPTDAATEVQYSSFHLNKEVTSPLVLFV